MSQPFVVQGEAYLGVSVMALVNMEGEAQLRPETELWQLVGKELVDCGGVIDLAYPKEQAEYLVTGYAYTAHQSDKTQCMASVSVDTLKKALQVTGDRFWNNDKPSHPEPFEQMRLSWLRSFGGEGCDDNPVGMGAPVRPEPEEEEAPDSSKEDEQDDGKAATAEADTQVEAEEPRPIANIESMDERIVSPDEFYSPANFGPIDISWPCRMKLLGSYDDHTPEKNGDGFQATFDTAFFNMAPVDQRFDSDHLKPGASFSITHMHPERPVLQGQLPSWRARCFVQKKISADEIAFIEVTMRHTTVWFFPHLEQMILVYHGLLPIRESDAGDVQVIMPALEPISSPRTVEHYQEVWARRNDPEKAATYAFQEVDLLPAEAIGSWIDTDEGEEGKLHNRVIARSQHLQEEHKERIGPEGKMPDVSPPESAKRVPPLSELTGFITQVEHEAKQIKDTARVKAAEYDIDLDNDERLSRRPKGPVSYHNMRNQLRDRAEKYPDDVPPEHLEASERALHRMYLNGVQAQDVADRLTDADSAKVRARVEMVLAGSRDFTDMDLTGADLSSIDFSNACLRYVLLENANLTGCTFDGADMTEAMLARAEMKNVSLRQTHLQGASLIQTQCTECDFFEVDLSDAKLLEASFTQCDFSGATFKKINLDKVFLTDCCFDYATLDTVGFLGMSLKKVTFTAATLNKIIFNECSFEEVVFDKASLTSCSTLKLTATGTSFAESNLIKVAFTAGTHLEESNFFAANLTECNFRSMPLTKVSFRGAEMTTCDLSEAQLHQADMSYCKANGCLFIASDLTDANFSYAQLMEALLKKANMTRTNFHYSNLFRADISEAFIDDTTLMSEAYLVQAKKYPLYKETVA